MGRRRRDTRNNKIYLVSRRCTRRYFLLSPDGAGIVARIFWYWIGYAALLTGIQICAVNLMSSHFHLVVVDRLGLISNFLHILDRNLALAIKAYRGWPEEVFNKSQASCVELLGTEAVLKEMSYTIGNASTSFAVRYSKDWPGAVTRVEDVGVREIRAKHMPYWSRRPGRKDPTTGAYLDDEEPWIAKEDDRPEVRCGWPHAVEFRIEWPEVVLEQMKEEEARRRLAAGVRYQERKAWRQAKERGYSFSNPKRIVRQKHTRRARSWETFGSRNPRFSAAGDLEAALAAIERNRKFDRQYDQALELWRSGDRRRAVFPHGTWKMRIVHNARCRPPP
ncbi:MAG: hypothetical protein AAGF12_22680 [Myxococcota bacterium]